MPSPDLKLLAPPNPPEVASGGASEEGPEPSFAFILSLRRGDADALRILYRAHHQSLRALGRHLLGNAEDAEDLVHEVFLAVPGALRRYRGDCSLRTFLASIAVKRSGKVLRRLGRYRRAIGVFADDASGILGRDDHPETAAELKELASALADELRRLPFAQRAAVVLCLVEERSAAEAAQILGIPENTVRTRVFYGRRRLRKGLERHR